MASPAYRSISAVAFASTDSAVITPPSGLADNDILLLLVHKQSTAALTIPSGFTLKSSLSAVSVNAFEGRLYWKRAASESGNYTVSWTGATFRQAFIAAISGCTTSGDPFDVSDAQVRDDATSAVTPTGSLTTTVAETLLVWISENRWGGAWTVPTSFTEHYDDGASGVLNLCTLAQAGIGGTGSHSTTNSQGNNPCGFYFGALKPAAAPSVFPENFFQPWQPRPEQFVTIDY